jgi:hypothetical protein
MAKLKIPFCDRDEARKLRQQIEEREQEARVISQCITEIYEAEDKLNYHMKAAQFHIQEYRRIKRENGFG